MGVAVYGGRGKEGSYGKGIVINVPSGLDRTWTEPHGRSYQILKSENPAHLAYLPERLN